MMQECLLILIVTFKQTVKIRVTFISTLKESSMEFHQMKQKLLQHIVIHFFRTLTTCNTKCIAYCAIEESDQEYNK